MGSRQLFDPLVALRVAPLITSTCALWYGWDQQFFFGIFTRPENQAKSRALLPSYFQYCFNHGVVSVLGVLTLTLTTSITNLYRGRAVLQDKQSFHWYAAGAALTASHLLFVPFVAPSVQRLFEDPTGDNAIENMEKWLSVNAIRTLTVDLAAWGSFAVAVMRTLTV